MKNDIAPYKSKLDFKFDDLEDDAKEALKEIDETIGASKWYFLKPGTATLLVNYYFWTFTGFGLFAYLIHFAFFATITNLYSMAEKHSCGGVEWSEKYDSTLTVLFAYHLIAWIRVIFFLVCVLMGVNLMHGYYILSLNLIFGFVAWIIGMSTNFSTTCENADSINLLLTMNMVYFIVFALPLETLHIIPFIIVDKRNKVTLADALRKEHIPEKSDKEKEEEEKAKLMDGPSSKK